MKVRQKALSNFFRWTSLAFVGTLGLITIVGSGGGGGGNGDGEPTSLLVNAESGIKQPIDGTWSSCTDDVSNVDRGGRIFFNGPDLVSEEYYFTSTDGSCTGQPMVFYYNKGTATTSGDLVASGWVDKDDSVVSAPTNQAGTGTLQPNPLVSKGDVSIEIITPIGDTGIVKSSLYMDDTAATWCLHFGGGPDDNIDGYPDYVSNEGRCKDSGTFTPLATLIYAESASMQLFDGIWQRPCATDGTDYVEQIVVAAGTFKFQNYTYTSSDGSCSTDEAIATLAEGTVSTGSNFATLGWHDGVDPEASAPTAQSGSGLLTDPPTVTKLTIVIPTDPSAGTYYKYFYIDDTAATWCMYIDEGPNDPTVEYNEYLYNAEPYCKV